MDDFETVAFAGLEADQRNILWVRHSALPINERSLQLQHSAVSAQNSTAVTSANLPAEQSSVKNEHCNAVNESATSQAFMGVASDTQSSVVSVINSSEQSALQKNLPDIKSWGPTQQWSDLLWQKFKCLVESGVTGEEFMKIFEFKRRKELESVFYKLSKYYIALYTITWEADFENGEHALPDLKSSKEGLRISNTRFKRYGIDVTPNTYFKLTKISDTKIELIIIR